MSTPMNRNPAGTPSGGQFATGHRAEAEIGLDESFEEFDRAAAEVRYDREARQVDQYLEAFGWSRIEDWARRVGYTSRPLEWEDRLWMGPDGTEIEMSLHDELVKTMNAEGFQATPDMDYDECSAELDDIGRTGTSLRHIALLDQQMSLADRELEEAAAAWRDNPGDPGLHERVAAAEEQRGIAFGERKTVGDILDPPMMRAAAESVIDRVNARYPTAEGVRFDDNGVVPVITRIRLADGTEVPAFTDDPQAREEISDSISVLIRGSNTTHVCDDFDFTMKVVR